MDVPSENTSSLQTDERYKKLERAVKIIQMMQLDKKDAESCTSTPTINISSIHGDAFDTSCAFSFKLGSEVVSSSNNMRNLVSQKVKTLNKNNNNKITTSSVRASPSNDEAKAIMPPPKTIPIFSQLLNKNTSTKSSCSFQETLQPNHEISTGTKENNVSSTIQPDRIFQKWKVSINDKGQLVIQGKLKDSDKTVKSKPVIRRLSSVMVQSCYNNIYELQGRIYDEQNVLPEYIRGKFYNGFPDDWENVYQLWRSYIAGGYKPTFRWPTPVTDSDDDLQSDITEITYYKVPKKSYDCIDSSRNQCEKNMPLQKLSEGSLEKSSYEHLIKRVENEMFCAGEITNTNKVSPKRSPNQSIQKNNTSQQINSFLDQVNNLPVNNSSLETSVINEDISSAVSKIFASRNISIECIDKIIEMFNCYKYVVMANPANSSPRATTNNEDSSKNISSAGNVKNFNVTYTNSKINKNCLPHNHRTYDYDHQITPRPSRKRTSMKNIRTIRKKLSNIDYDSDEDSVDDSEYDSESEGKKNEFCKKNFRSSRMPSTRYVENKSLNDRAEIVKGYKFKHQFNEESDDNFIRRRTKYQNPGHTSLTKSGKKIDDQVNVKYPIAFKNPSPQIQYKKELQDYGNVKSPSPKHRRQQNQSPSKVTRFSNDSCVSLSEDDLDIKQNHFELTDKKITTQLHRNMSLAEGEINQPYSHHYDDSFTSCNESEVVVDNKIKSHDAKKQVLQESNMQLFQPMLDNNTRYTKNKFFFGDMKNKSQSYQEARHESREHPLQDKGSKELSHDRHAETYANDNKENKSNQVEKKSLIRKVPTVVGVEEVFFDINPQSSKKNYRGGVNKSRSPKEHDIENDFEGDDQYTKNSSKISEKNSSMKVSSLDLSPRSSKSKFAVQSKDLSTKVKSINNKTKNEHLNQEANLDKSSIKVIFGSEENPKKLTKWIPKILKKPDLSYGLVFEGDLLNEIGHVESKKFITGFIIRRLSPKIIESEEHEFYELVGHLTDTKYIIPRDLRKLCYDRCPSRISQFCERWRNIILKDINESQALNSTADISQSLRGRRRYPYLSYWTGERVFVKNNEVVYNPGDSSKSTIYSPFDTSKNLKKKDSPQKKDLQLSTDQTSSSITTTKKKEQNKEKYSRSRKEMKFDDKSENRKEIEFPLRSSLRSSNRHNLSKDGHSGTKETVTLEKKNLNNIDKKEKEKNIDKNFNKKRDSSFEDKNVESRKKLRELRSKVKREKIKLRKSNRSQNRRISLKEISTSYDSSSEEDHPMSKRRKGDSNDTRKNENLLENANMNDEEYKSSKEKFHRKHNDSRTNSNESNEITVKYCKEIPSKNDVDFSNFESSF